MRVQWTPDLAVGHVEIDTQHKELFVKVNALLEAMHAGKGRDEVESTLTFLERYVVHHFGTEERMMARAGYPELTHHKAQHAAFIADLDGWKAKLASGATLATTIDLQRALTDWLRSHIGRTDQALATFLQARADSLPASSRANR
jgi:hemerythrin-like metal-binding protein